MNADTFWKQINLEIQKEPPISIHLSTYSFYSAIKNYPYGTPPYHKLNSVQRILHHMNNTKQPSDLICGKINKNEYITEDIERWPNICWYKSDSHAKILILQYEKKVRVWNGSCNLTPGNAIDLSSEITCKEEKKLAVRTYGLIMRESKKLYSY